MIIIIITSIPPLYDHYINITTIIWGLLKIGDPKTIRFNTTIVEFWMIRGYPHFRKRPYIIMFIIIIVIIITIISPLYDHYIIES